MEQTDVLIIGGGIVGLATAYDLTRNHPGKRVVVLEKEASLAHHQTGRNSGVLHSGIYYKPESLKAVNCREGRKAMVDFCEAEGVDYYVCGKVIVAVSDAELPRLDGILQRGQQNGIRCEMIGPERLGELEPHTAGIRAIHVPDTGIVNFRQVCQRLAEHIRRRDGRIVTGTLVTGMTHENGGVIVHSPAGDFHSRYVVNCAGLHSDRVTRLSGQRPKAKIVPFRGEYFQLRSEAGHLCKNLIYPVPDPSFPFLGVHFTRRTDGTVECGPNAVLAFSREGYNKFNINVGDLVESVSYPGFLRLAAKYWKTGTGEMWRSVSKAAFVKALRRLMPEIRSEHLKPAPSGVRAQAVSRDGNLVDDFVIQKTDRVVNVGNAPSPAATAALNVGKLISQQLTTRLDS